MTLYKNINSPGHYTLLLLAIALRIALFYFSPTYNGYVYDFYSGAINLIIENGRIIDADDCFICYHPQLFPIIGAIIVKTVSALGGDYETQYSVIGIFTIFISLVFCLFSYGIYRLYHKENNALNLTVWALILFLPLVFISSYSIEADLLVATLIIMSIYFFLVYQDKFELKPLIYSSICVGLAAFTKYSGLICFFVLGLFLLINFWKDRRVAIFYRGCLFATICFVIGGYPYVHNVTKFGTPFKGNYAWHSDKYFLDQYNFTRLDVGDIVKVIEYKFDGVGDKRLHTFPAYNNDVLSSLYGQLWTDFSFFSSYGRHGGGLVHAWGLYKSKNIPIQLVQPLLYLGLIPVFLSIIGLLVIIRKKQAAVLMSFALVTMAVYFEWMIGSDAWMIKSKYLMQLLPLWLILIGFGAQRLNAKYAYLSIIPSVVCSFFYCLYFAVT